MIIDDDGACTSFREKESTLQQGGPGESCEQLESSGLSYTSIQHNHPINPVLELWRVRFSLSGYQCAQIHMGTPGKLFVYMTQGLLFRS
jgi:hypothetical protein